MPNVVFVAPYFLETTLRFVQGAAQLPGVRLGLVSTDREEKLPPGLRSLLAGHYRVENSLDPDLLTQAVSAMGRHLGSVDRLLGTLEELQEPLARVRESLGIDGMNLVTAHNFRDKSRMKEVLSAAGLPCARHALCGSESEALRFASIAGYPLVVKPPAGAGARQTFRVEDPDALKRSLGVTGASPSAPVLVEEFMTGREHSFDSVMIDGRPHWYSISRYSPTPLHVLENPWIQWSVVLPKDISGDEFRDVPDAAFRSLVALGHKTGLTHMEWFRRPDGSLAISEVAARPPGAQFTSLISYAHHFDLYSEWARLMIFDAFEAPPRKYAVGAVFLRGQGTGRVTAIRGVDEVNREIGGLVVESKLPQPGQAPSGGYEGEGYVILRHPETDVVEKALGQLLTTLRVELG
jgi:biotin carboxylase